MIFFVTQALMYQSKYSQNDFGTEDFASDHICTEILHDYCTCYSSIKSNSSDETVLKDVYGYDCVLFN